MILFLGLMTLLQVTTYTDFGVSCLLQMRNMSDHIEDITPGSEFSSPLSIKAFVMCVRGSVWALGWCPRDHQSSTFDTNVEVITQGQIEDLFDVIIKRFLLAVLEIVNLIVF